jgi:hypothetical protein
MNALPILTSAQLERLEKLDAEIAGKKAYEEKHRARKLASSKKTGIPYDLVDSDVVKIGTLLGLIKSSDSQSHFSLLDAFMGGDVQKYDYSKIPPYFSIVENCSSEQEKMDQQRQYVANECASFYQYITQELTRQLVLIERVVSIALINITIEDYITTINDNLIAVLDALRDEDDDELWHQLRVLRNALFLVTPICDYKKLVAHHITTLTSYRKSQSQIARNLSYIDANLSLYPGFPKIAIQPIDIDRIDASLNVRNHTKNPELKPFDMSEILLECCTPILLFVDAKIVIESGIIGPYRNNAICFINSSFYVMKCITGGIRMWILDENLTTFSEQLRSHCLSYCIKLFRAYYLAHHGSNAFQDDRIDGRVFETLLKSISWLKSPTLVRAYICDIVRTKSPHTPTEIDVFNEFPHGESIKLAKNIKLPNPLFDSEPSASFRERWFA